MMNTLKVFTLLSFLSSVVGNGGSGVIDMMTGQTLTKPWLSAGQAFLSTVQWTSLQSDSSYAAKSVDSSVVLMSLPDIGGPYADANATAIRIRNVQYDGLTGKVSFDAKVCLQN